MTDLPLFLWQPTAKVIAFPGGRLKGKARHVAKLFLSKSEKARKAYWRQIAQSYIDTQTKIGFSEETARGSLDEFRLAVEHEIALIELRDRQLK